MKSMVFTGTTWHQRFAPRTHSFRYRLFWLSIDLDELPMLDRSLFGFRVNRRRVASIHQRDYAGAGDAPIQEKLDAILAKRGMHDVHRVTLMTVPRILGYVFNPVSFYLLRHADESIIGLVAEVRNTFGDMHHYVLRPESRTGTTVHFTCEKALYVSPFLDPRGTYSIDVDAHENQLGIDLTLWQEGQRTFAASMRGTGRPLTCGTFWRVLLGYPFHAATVMLRIHWQAARLYVGKRLPMYALPEHAMNEQRRQNAGRSVWHVWRAAIVSRARKPTASAASSAPSRTLESEVS